MMLIFNSLLFKKILECIFKDFFTGYDSRLVHLRKKPGQHNFVGKN